MASAKQCSICLAKRSDVEPVLSENKSTALDIYLLTGVMIIEVNNMKSALICKICLADLTIAKNFHNRVKRFQNVLKSADDSIERKFWEEQREKIIIGDNPLKSEEPSLDDELIAQEIKIEPDIDFQSGNEDFSSNIDEAFLPKIKEPTKKISCQYCSKKLSKRSLSYHIQVQHEALIYLKYGCDYCGKFFPSKYPLKRHILRTHFKIKPPPKPYDPCENLKRFCTICNKEYTSRKTYLSHCRTKHSVKGHQEYPCSFCGKVFTNKRCLTSHEKSHKIVLPHEYFYCDLCGNKFKEKVLLLIHIKARHIRKIRYQCDICPCSYVTNHSLQKHINFRHKNIREWMCNWCGKSFGMKEKLIAHERIHTGEQPFQCNICNAKFTHQTDYRRHKWGHEGRKSYKCQICPEAFYKRSELISHKKNFH